MGTLYRAQILLERDQHEALKELAQSGEQSISEVVREIVRQYLAEQEQALQRQRELQALQDLARTRKKIREEHGTYQGDLLDEIRAEREQDTERVWSGDE